MTTLRLAVAAAALLALFACANPEADWQQAEMENTEAAYLAFLEKHPEGEWAQRAQTQLEALKDAQDWQHAQTADLVEAYNSYLLGHPAGAHMGEARQRVTELEQQAAWDFAQQAGSKVALEDFVTRFPDAPQADQARSQIAALAAPPPQPAPKPAAKPARQTVAKSAAAPKGKYQVQLGAFSSLDKARSEKGRVEDRYGATIGAVTIQNPTGAESLYRLKTTGMPESTARSTCQKLKNSGQECMVVQR
jgi:cell division septation protein DedD